MIYFSGKNRITQSSSRLSAFRIQFRPWESMCPHVYRIKIKKIERLHMIRYANNNPPTCDTVVLFAKPTTPLYLNETAKSRLPTRPSVIQTAYSRGEKTRFRARRRMFSYRFLYSATVFCSRLTRMRNVSPRFGWVTFAG